MALDRFSQARLVDWQNIIEVVGNKGDERWAEDKSVKLFVDSKGENRFRHKINTGSNIDFCVKFLGMNNISAVNYILSNRQPLEAVEAPKKPLSPEVDQEVDREVQEALKAFADSLKIEEDETEVEETQDWESLIDKVKINNNFGSFRYLSYVRGIDETIFKWFYNQGLIFRGEKDTGYKKPYNSEMDSEIKKDETLTYFVYKNPFTGEITGLTNRENRDYRKMIGQKNYKRNYANCEWGFNVLKGTPKKAYIFEAPIDLLSFLTLNKNNKEANVFYMATGGTNHKLTKNTLEELRSRGLKEIVVATDNDEAGDSYYDKVKGWYKGTLSVTRLKPTLDGMKYNDWNDVLEVSKGI